MKIIKEKWLRNMTFTVLLIAIIVCAYLAINYGIGQANITDLDMTKGKIYSLSQETENKVKNINQPVIIYAYHMYEYVMDFANRYAKLSENITVEELENLNTKTEWKTTYGFDDTSSFLVISSEGKEKVLTEYDLYTYDYTTYEQIDLTEEAITNAILDVTVENKPKIYFFTGHNIYSDSYFQYLQTELSDEANEVETLDLIKTTKVPNDCSVLVLTALKEDITELERDAILTYIKKGGDILLLLDANLNQVKFTNFQKVLDEYGVSISDGVILEADTNKMISGAPNFVICNITAGASIISGINMEMNVCLINPAKLSFAKGEVLESKNVTIEELAHVSDKAFYRTNLAATSDTKIATDEDAANATVGAMLTKTIDEENTSKLIVFGNTAFATNTQIQVGTQYYMYAFDFYNNKDVILNSISYLTEREDTITIRKNVEAVTYTVTEAQNRIIATIIFAVPAIIVIAGITVWLMRRRS